MGPPLCHWTQGLGVKCRGKNGDPFRAYPKHPPHTGTSDIFSSLGPLSMKPCQLLWGACKAAIDGIWQQTAMPSSLKHCHASGWNNFVEPCGFLSSHSFGFQVRVLEKKMKKLGHLKTFQKWSFCATRECKKAECVYPLPRGCWHNREGTLSLFLFDWNTSRKAVERDGNQLFFHLPYYWVVVLQLPFLLSDLKQSFS